MWTTFKPVLYRARLLAAPVHNVYRSCSSETLACCREDGSPRGTQPLSPHARQLTTTSDKGKKKKVMIFGAGCVSAPVVDYLTRSPNTQVTVAAPKRVQLDRLSDNYPNTTPVTLQIDRSEGLVDDLIQSHDLVISLLPKRFHYPIMKKCVQFKTNMALPDYQTEEMTALHDQAVQAGVTIVTELGLDPGIDHFLAAECFDDVRNRGGKVTSYVSFCGAFQAPEYSDNPIKYKFGWNALGVLTNMLNGAKYIRNGKVCEIAKGGLLHSVEDRNDLPGFNLEGFANRDSTIYVKRYGIEEAETVLRGSSRYKGFAKTMKGLMKLGLLETTDHPSLHPDGPDITWRQFIAELSGAERNITVHFLKDHLHYVLKLDRNQIGAIEESGFLDDKLIEKQNTPIETLAHYMTLRFSYAPGERDIAIMRNNVGVEWPDGSTENRIADMVVYGDPQGYSAVSATTGFTTGIAAQMILNGEIQKTGVLFPFSKDIYQPILERLGKENVAVRQSVKPGQSAIKGRLYNQQY